MVDINVGKPFVNIFIVKGGTKQNNTMMFLVNLFLWGLRMEPSTLGKAKVVGMPIGGGVSHKVEREVLNGCKPHLASLSTSPLPKMVVCAHTFCVVKWFEASSIWKTMTSLRRLLGWWC